MATQLDAYRCVSGNDLAIKGRHYRIGNILEDGDTALAEMLRPRATYTAIRCNNTRVAGHPDAEVWAILANWKPRTLASFAVINKAIMELG